MWGKRVNSEGGCAREGFLRVWERRTEALLCLQPRGADKTPG